MNYEVSHLSSSTAASYAHCPRCTGTEVSVQSRTPSVLSLHCAACREAWTIPERRLTARVAVTAGVELLGGV